MKISERILYGVAITVLVISFFFMRSNNAELRKQVAGAAHTTATSGGE